MPRFLIERKLPGAGQMSQEQWQTIAAKSNGVLSQMRRGGMAIQWDHSYVTDDALYCVYVAPDAAAVREHARCGGFPCDAVMEIGAQIDPVTGE